MTKFYYRARNKGGDEVKSYVMAATRAEAFATIEAKEETPISIYTLQHDLTHGTAEPVHTASSGLWNKDQLAYRLLAFFVGGLGVHDFYAGRIKEGVLLLFLTILSFFGTPFIFIAVFVMVIVEMVTVDKDGGGVPMKKSRM
jgi:TM2 domain-containing membrane protein YozV